MRASQCGGSQRLVPSARFEVCGSTGSEKPMGNQQLVYIAAEKQTASLRRSQTVLLSFFPPVFWNLGSTIG